MREAGAPSTGECALAECARPTRGTHDLTTEAFTLLMSIGISLEIPKGPVPLRSDVRCTRYVCRHPAPLTRTRAPARAIVQRHPVGREEGTVGRASRARLSTPRHPTPLLSGTCLTSARGPPLRRILATEGPGYSQRWRW